MEKTTVITYIAKLISEAQPNPITGGQLSARVKVAFPEFNAPQFGCANLRQFIRDNIPDIAEKGKAGMDVIYGLRAEQQSLFGASTAETAPTTDQPTPLGQLLTNPRIWKTFASPDKPYRLYLLPSGLIRVFRPEETPDPTWSQIPPISAEALQRIAKEFISELPESQQEMLLKTLEQPRWWFPFFELLGALGQKSKWVFFRRRRIAEEFERSIPKVSAPSPASKALERTTRVEQAERPDSLLRHIASSAVERMTDSELRALNLPLGYVIDVLKAR